MPGREDFRIELAAQIERASRQGRAHIEINSGELHRDVGGYPPAKGQHHAMPACCNVMWAEHDKGRADIISCPKSRRGASLTIRYHLPR